MHDASTRPAYYCFPDLGWFPSGSPEMPMDDLPVAAIWQSPEGKWFWSMLDVCPEGIVDTAEEAVQLIENDLGRPVPGFICPK